jgi:hypothetical protein
MVAGLVGLGGFAQNANAGATIDLLFVSHNAAAIGPTNCIAVGIVQAGCHTVAAGDQVTMAVILRNDEPMTQAIYSLNYDLGGDNELDVVSAFSWGGVFISMSDRFQPFTPLDPPTANFVGSFQGATTNIALPRTLPNSPAGGYQMGTVTWQVTANAENDGVDIISGILNFGIDSINDATFNDMAARTLFRGASVTIPEPATASLLGLGLIGLALAGRRSRA